MEKSEHSPTPPSSPGSIMRQARESLGMSRKEMAESLNLPTNHIEALEENRFEDLRGPTYVRGYLRAFAKQVGVGGAELLAAYEAMPGAASSEEHMSQPLKSTFQPPIQKLGWTLPASGAFVVALLLALWFFQGTREGLPFLAEPPADGAEPESPAASGASLEPAAGEAASPAAGGRPGPGEGETASPAAGGRLEEPGGDSPADLAPDAAGPRVAVLEETAAELVPDALPDAEATLAGAPPGDGAAAREPRPAAGEPAPGGAPPPLAELAEPGRSAPAPERDVGAEAAAEPAAGGVARAPRDIAIGAAEGEVLQFDFSGECWLEVRDASGELVYQDLFRDGDRARMTGVAPFRVKIGDFRHARLTYRGEEVAIARPRFGVVATQMVGGQ